MRLARPLVTALVTAATLALAACGGSQITAPAVEGAQPVQFGQVQGSGY
jgi:hypothetical protein